MKRIKYSVIFLLVFSILFCGIWNADRAMASASDPAEQYVIELKNSVSDRATVAFMNNTDHAISVVFLLATYQEDGRMLTCASSEASLAVREAKEVTINYDERAVTLKAFVLDAKTMKPLWNAWVCDSFQAIPQKDSNRVLVAYFSCTNNTEKIAEYVAETVGADLHRITPETPYTSADLNYGNSSSRSSIEQNDATARPTIKGKVENMADYNVVFLGYPIWWGQAPKIMYTFMESYDFTNKTIVPFCTSGSSPIGSSATNLRASAEGANWEDGRRFSSSASQEEVEAWAKEFLVSDVPTVDLTSETIALTIAGTPMSVSWADNSSVDALKELLRGNGSITLDMSDYAGFEKGAPLPETLPQNNEQMNTDAGDIILYQGRQFVIYYDTNTYSLTPLGKINGITKEELQALLGAGNVSATLSLMDVEKANVEPIVYFTSDISAAGLLAVYEKLGWNPTGKVAVKVSTGEPPASNYLRPELIGDLVKSVNGTIVECNTAYGGSRASTAAHYQVAKDHGFTSIADFDLMDEDGEVEWSVTDGTRLDHIIVGSHAENYADWLILSHYKGHQMAGFGGAIKNVGIGASSASGKVLVHTAGTKTSGSIFYSDQDAWLEALAEMVDGFVDHVGEEHIVYINVMNRLSIDCDCNGHPTEPDIHDIGILASTDPVALDQACYDLVKQAEGNGALMNRIERQHGLHTLEHAEEIGLGNRTYQLVNVDE